MSLKVWIDGKLVDKNDAKVSVYDHGLLYGDGVFEGIRVYNGRVFECDAHLRRLYDSAKAIRLTIPISIDQYKAAIEQTVKANNFTDCYIRAIVTLGVLMRRAVGHHHHRSDPGLSGRDVRQGDRRDHRIGDPQPSQCLFAADQKPELSEQHPRKD